jgi:biotin carboxylase
MARFIAFVDKRADIGDYHRDFPEHDFLFLSHRAPPRRPADLSAVGRGPAWLAIDDERLPRVLEGLAREHASRPFQGIVFGSTPEIYVLDAARTAQALGLPRFLHHPEAARDKHAMRRLLSGHAACPPTRLIRSAADLEQAADVGFPCVLKPRHGYGSVCVVKPRDRGHLRDEYRRMRASLAVLSRETPAAIASDDMLLEPFVGGTEHTVELFVRDGHPALGIVSDKLPMVPPWFLETGDIMPSGLTPPDRELVLAAARSAARALCIEQGWAHVEIKLHDGVAYVIEIAARNGGGYTREMLRLAYGIDPRKTLVDHHLGIPPVQPLRESNTVVGRNVLARGLTLAWGIRGRDRWLGHRCFREISQRLHGGLPRLVAGPPYSFDSTLMSFFVFDPDRERALATFAAADATIAPRCLELAGDGPATHAAFLAALRLRGWLRRSFQGR